MIPYYPDNNITIYNYHRQCMDGVQMKRTESEGHFRGGPFATWVGAMLFLCDQTILRLQA